MKVLLSEICEETIPQDKVKINYYFFPGGLQGQLLSYVYDSNYEKRIENTLIYSFDYVIFFLLQIELWGISKVQNEKFV